MSLAATHADAVRWNPARWSARPFGSLVEEFRYGTSNKSEEVGLPALRIPNVVGGGLDLSDLKCVPVSGAEEGRLRLLDGDLLFVRTNGNPDYVGRCAVFSEDAVGGTGFATDRFIYASYLIRARLRTDEIEPAFVREFMLSTAGRTQLRKNSKTSAGQYNINIDGLSSIQVPLPSLDEQRDVVRILRQTRKICRSRQESIAALDQLPGVIFKSMFGDLVNSPQWPSVKVGDFVQGFQTGKNIAPAEEESGLRVLKVSAVTSGVFNPTESKPAPLGHAPPQSHFVREGDLLFSRANTSELIGATALVGAVPPNLLLPDKLWRFVWHEPATVVPVFVHYLFQRPEFRQRISQVATGTSSSMKNISQAKVLALTCGLPPLDLQLDFARKAESVASLRESTVESQAESDAFFAALQYQAFDGEL